MARSIKRYPWPLLLILLPVYATAAPPPYWPGYPTYYYPYPANITSSDGTSSEGTKETLDSHPETDSATKTEAQDKDSPPAISEKGTASLIQGNQTPVVPKSNEIRTSTEQLAEKELNEALSQEIARDIQQGNFAEAYYLWRPRAEAGDAEAQYGIGWMYHNGYGLAINDDEAISWWEMAARQGHLGATFALGMLYSLGEGAQKRDMQKAVNYYREAARHGHADAQLLLLSFAANGEKHARQLLIDQMTKGDLLGITDFTQITAKRANIRKGPGTGNKILFTAKEGLKVAAIKRQGNWLLVALEGKDFLGWIHDSLLQEKLLKDG